MKNLIVIFLLSLTHFNCKAQNAPLYQMNPDLPEGTHYKDIDNDFDNFIGTWVYQGSNSIITLEIQKREDVYFADSNQFEDIIIGEYKYEYNGNILQDYLYRLNDTAITDVYDYNIVGNSLLHKNQNPVCEECSQNERRVFLYFDDPTREYIDSAIILKPSQNNNGVITMDGRIFSYNYFVKETEESPSETTIPFGEYTFVKQ